MTSYGNRICELYQPRNESSRKRRHCRRSQLKCSVCCYRREVGGKSGCDKVIRKLSFTAKSSGNCRLALPWFGLQDAVNKGTLIYVTRRGEGNAADGNGRGGGVQGRIGCFPYALSLRVLRLVGQPMFVFVTVKFCYICNSRLTISIGAVGERKSVRTSPVGFLERKKKSNFKKRNILSTNGNVLTEMSTRNLPGGKRRPARRADNLAAICVPNV
jgi:hypothetical protein